MMAGMKLDMGRSLLAEGAARQFRPEGFSEEVDDLLRGSGGVGDVESRMALVIAIAHFQSLFDGELETSSFPILYGAVEDGLSVFALGVDVGSVAEEILEWLNVVAKRGVGERRGALYVAIVDVDSVTNREVDAVDVAASRSVMQNRLSHVSATHQIRPMLD